MINPPYGYPPIRKEHTPGTPVTQATFLPLESNPDNPMIQPAGKAPLALINDADATGRPQVQTMLAGLSRRLFKVTVERWEPTEDEAFADFAKQQAAFLAKGAPDA